MDLKKLTEVKLNYTSKHPPPRKFEQYGNRIKRSFNKVQKVPGKPGANPKNLCRKVWFKA